MSALSDGDGDGDDIEDDPMMIIIFVSSCGRTAASKSSCLVRVLGLLKTFHEVRMGGDDVLDRHFVDVHAKKIRIPWN